MSANIDIKQFWAAVLRQDADEIRSFFHPSADIYWHCTNERFTVEEFIKANCEYPGCWDGEIEKTVVSDGLVITATCVYTKERSASFHAVTFFKISDGKIVTLDEYWGDDSEPPKWRRDMKIGRTIDE